MPVVFSRDIGGGVLGLWKIEEPIEELARLCLPADRTYASTLSEKRKPEFFAWRALLQALEPGAQAGYDDQGGPVLTGVGEYSHIGVSHTTGYAAVILSKTPCAVDIERADRDFSKTFSRYASAEEQSLFREAPPVLHWCAEETLYKWARQSGVDGLREIGIETLSSQAGTLSGTIRGRRLAMHYFFEAGICCVWGLE